MILRQRMSILLIRRLLSNPYFKRSYHFSLNEIENLIQCIGPHVVISTNGKTTALNGLIPLETKLLAMICFFAGGSAYNIFPLFGIGHTSLFRFAEIYPGIATEPVGGTGLKATGLEASWS